VFSDSSATFSLTDCNPVHPAPNFGPILAIFVL